MQTVKLRKTMIETVQAAKISVLDATLEDGAKIAVSGPVSVGDYYVVDAGGAASVLPAADYAAELVAA